MSDAGWQKSALSGGSGGQCVEVAADPPRVVAVRDGKDPGGPKPLFGPAGRRAFVGGVKAGEFDVSR
ncbi:DUF397 domain-containing protein [Streptosporangium sandarakinum]|uniref:DUF397 domain-containing protein n=1 Tax=Streptosporangium sandarakinum TaxID=1260955 RepID=UPI00341E0D66